MAKKREELENDVTNAQAKLDQSAKAYNDYIKAGYTASGDVAKAKAQYDAANKALADYAPYTNPNAAAMQQALTAIVNRPAFKFSTDGDALYERYKNDYQAAGKKAMEDTMGQAAMLTGGYGNSYAATAGAQAYNDYISRMDEVVPQLYQMALDKYNTEGDQLAQKYNLLASDDDRGYSRWQSDRALLADAADRAQSGYYNERSFDYGQWGDRGSGLSQLYKMAGDAYDIANAAEKEQYDRDLAAAKLYSGGGSGGGNGALYASYGALPDVYKSKIDEYVNAGNLDAAEDLLLSLVDNGFIPESEAAYIADMLRAEEDNRQLHVMVGSTPVYGTRAELEKMFGRKK